MTPIAAPTVPPLTRRRAALVATGGALGAGARWAIGEVVGAPRLDGVPWTLLVVNIVGSAVLVWALVESRRRPDRASLLIDGLGTGFCGGLTTFSALAFTTAAQLRGGEAAWAALTMATVLTTGIAAAIASRWLATRAAATAG